MDDLLSRFQRTGSQLRNGASEDVWAPVVDISESPKHYTVRADLRGVKKEDVKISVENGVLTVSGERKSEVDDKSERCYRLECSYGAYSRSFSLPENVAQDNITAESKEGVLIINLPKTDIKQATLTHIKVQ
jgi:HSP20 family protein